MRTIITLFIIFLFGTATNAQSVKRDPEPRKDIANVYYKIQYTLFDLWSDEPILPIDGYYTIYYTTNENKTPKQFRGTAQDLTKMTVYKFKNLSNCQNWINGVKFERQSTNILQTSNSSNSSSSISYGSASEKTNLQINTPSFVYRRNISSPTWISREAEVLSILQKKKELEEQIHSNELKFNEYSKNSRYYLNTIEFNNMRNVDIYYTENKSLIGKLIKLCGVNLDNKEVDKCVLYKDYARFRVSFYETRNYWKLTMTEDKSDQKVLKLLAKNDVFILDEKSKMEKIKMVTGVDDEYFILKDAIEKDKTELDSLNKKYSQSIGSEYIFYGNFDPQGNRQFGILLNLNRDTLFIGSWIRNLPGADNGKLYLYGNSTKKININNNKGYIFEEYQRGDIYIGQSDNGFRNGNGTYIWVNGDSYIGDWQNGERTGYGIYEYVSGQKYQGDFVKGNMNGMGIMTYSNGSKKEGLFENNNFIKSKETIEQERIAEQERIEQERRQKEAEALAAEEKRKKELAAPAITLKDYYDLWDNPSKYFGKKVQIVVAHQPQGWVLHQRTRTEKRRSGSIQNSWFQGTQYHIDESSQPKEYEYENYKSFYEPTTGKSITVNIPDRFFDNKLIPESTGESLYVITVLVYDITENRGIGQSGKYNYNMGGGLKGIAASYELISIKRY